MKRKAHKEILYKTSKILEDKNYELEIASLEGKMILTATSLKQGEKITIKIPEEKSIYIILNNS